MVIWVWEIQCNMSPLLKIHQEHLHIKGFKKRVKKQWKDTYPYSIQQLPNLGVYWLHFIFVLTTHRSPPRYFLTVSSFRKKKREMWSQHLWSIHVLYLCSQDSGTEGDLRDLSSGSHFITKKPLYFLTSPHIHKFWKKGSIGHWVNDNDLSFFI